MAHGKLSRPDVRVTNQSDKDMQLPKVLELDEKVKSPAARSRPTHVSPELCRRLGCCDGPSEDSRRSYHDSEAKLRAAELRTLELERKAAVSEAEGLPRTSDSLASRIAQRRRKSRRAIVSAFGFSPVHFQPVAR